MDNNDFVRDDEVLYRSVRGKLNEEYSYDDTGKLRFSSQAFRDISKKPSVDRAELKGFNPSLTKLSHTDGIVSLITRDIRAIGTVETKTQDADAVIHAVNVVYDPTPENPAHSQITVKPEFFGSKNKQKNAFKLLRRALAKLATKNGWTLEPSLQ